MQAHDPAHRAARAHLIVRIGREKPGADLRDGVEIAAAEPRPSEKDGIEARRRIGRRGRRGGGHRVGPGVTTAPFPAAGVKTRVSAYTVAKSELRGLAAAVGDARGTVWGTMSVLVLPLGPGASLALGVLIYVGVPEPRRLRTTPPPTSSPAADAAAAGAVAATTSAAESGVVGGSAASLPELFLADARRVAGNFSLRAAAHHVAQTVARGGKLRFASLATELAVTLFAGRAVGDAVAFFAPTADTTDVVASFWLPASAVDATTTAPAAAAVTAHVGGTAVDAAAYFRSRGAARRSASAGAALATAGTVASLPPPPLDIAAISRVYRIAEVELAVSGRGGEPGREDDNGYGDVEDAIVGRIAMLEQLSSNSLSSLAAPALVAAPGKLVGGAGGGGGGAAAAVVAGRKRKGHERGSSGLGDDASGE